MKEILHFLRELQRHNDRSWFTEHKAEYQQIQTKFNRLVEEVIQEISRYDSTVSGLTAKDCTYRIYRDVRFSDDKSPYKTHFGAFICPGGKKSGYSGYYFHIATGGDDYPDAHMLAAGDYCCDPQVLKLLREDIADGDGDFDRIVKSTAPLFAIDTEGALKRNPKGYAADAPYSEYLRLKSFCLVANVDDGFWLKGHLAQRIAEAFRPTKPFLDYVNRAVACAKEGNR
jgi:uncharacterized protein (TIGR02453 family)